MDERRKENIAYVYLCHLEEAKMQVDLRNCCQACSVAYTCKLYFTLCSALPYHIMIKVNHISSIYVTEKQRLQLLVLAYVISDQ